MPSQSDVSVLLAHAAHTASVVDHVKAFGSIASGVMILQQLLALRRSGIAENLLEFIVIAIRKRIRLYSAGLQVFCFASWEARDEFQKCRFENQLTDQSLQQ
jgi:hypothetical protein